MNKLFLSLKGAWGTIFAVLMVILFVTSSITLYRLDIRKISNRIQAIEIQNNSAIEYKRAADLQDIIKMLAQKKKIEEIERNITNHQNIVDKKQREILESVSKIQKDQLKTMNEKQKEILDLLKLLEQKQIKGTYNVSKEILDNIKELKESHRRIEGKLK